MAAGLRAEFVEHFGREPDGLWAAPGRVNLIGEHTDYNDGLVLPFALPQHTLAAASRRSDTTLRVRSVNTAESEEFELTALVPGTHQGWSSYVAGVFWALSQAGYASGGMDIAVSTTVPLGAGLSSSAALECAVACAAAELSGHHIEPLDLAVIAQRAENDYVGMPCGLMDQMVSMVAREGHAVLFDTRSRQVKHVPFAADHAEILVIDTKAPHKLVDGEYAARRSQCKQACVELGIPSLRELNNLAQEDLESAMRQLSDDVLRRRVRHVVTENQRVLDMVEALQAGRLEAAGALMNASHASLRDDYEVTVPEVDLAQRTLVSAGAYGARITGGGFGGCVIALVETDTAGSLQQEVVEAYAEAGFTAPEHFVAIPSSGARRVSSARNWAGNVEYSARRIAAPSSYGELRSLISSSDRVKAIGSRHSFSTIAHTVGDLISLEDLPRVFEIDEQAGTVTVDAGIRYGELAQLLQERGWALQSMASLPHITVVGSVATGTHGSGDDVPALSAAVRSVEMMVADGSTRIWRRGDQNFGGVVVSLGALGVVTRLSLDIVPSFELRQDVYDGLPWQAVLENFDALTGAAYSVSLFTRWVGETFGHAWLKSTQNPPEELCGTRALTHDVGLVEGAVEATTAQSGVWGSWDARLPHFKLHFTPSNGNELQSEYLLPRENAVEALRRMRDLGPHLEPHLLLSEVRTMAPDDQWMSPAYGRQTVGIHFTWRQHPHEVAALLPLIEEQLMPLGARPHWGKLSAAPSLGQLYPRFPEFCRLAAELDPEGRFRNDFLDRLFTRNRPDGYKVDTSHIPSL
ncbi:galactokinase [Nesterenkonia sp. Hz 6-5]|nr:galactokinase [Nesterenkonia haasae]